VLDTLPGKAACALTPQQQEDYRDHGYIILRRVFAIEEIAAAALEVEYLLQKKELIDTQNIRCRWQNHIETNECLFETFDPVIDIGPICGRIARDDRIFAALEGIYGERAHLFKDKLIFKPPGARGYDMHQDYIGWKSFPRSFVTVMVAIDPADPENGATEVFPGYHQKGYLSPEDGDYHPCPAGAVDGGRAVLLDLQPGDIAIFGCFTPHRSAPNRSNRWRRQLYLSYNASSDGGDQREAHYREFHEWLKGKYAQYGKRNVYFR
jgi:ectoine hydroxylase-related dioxygenase (phytanoyl-CoA dioxygenase family)